MILQRLASATLNQKWSQIITEILIVVIGIFLGLQVDDWNKAQQHRVEEIIYLERMLEDADNSLERNRQLLVTMENQKSGRETFNKLLANKEFTEENLKGAAADYRLGFTEYQRVTYYEDTIEELISTGNLSIIGSREFKNKMARFKSEIERNFRIVTTNAEMLVQPYNRLIDLISFNIDTNLILTSPEVLNSNQQFYNVITSMEGRRRVIYDANISTYDLSKVFRDEIAAELARLQ